MAGSLLQGARKLQIATRDELRAHLQAEGLMTVAGRAAVARAQAYGSWTALDEVQALAIPPDLQVAFDTAPGTGETWRSWPRSTTRGALEVLLNPRRPAARTAGTAEIPRSARAGDRPFQWRRAT